MTAAPRSVAVVGASGYLGRVLVRSLLQDLRGIGRILALDIKPLPPLPDPSGVLTFEEMDVRSARLGELLDAH